MSFLRQFLLFASLFLLISPPAFAIDFNADGFADVFWRNAPYGQNRIWQMNGHTKVAGQTINQLQGSGWVVGGLGDFDNDGKTDIMWRNQGEDAQNRLWLMNGFSRKGGSVLPLMVDTQWVVAGVADFDGDGKSDILWRHTEKPLSRIWLMNTFFKKQGATLPVQSNDWYVRGTDDFNGDGKADILWRNKTNGENRIWFMNGVSRINGGNIPNMSDLDWCVAGVGDFDADGKADIVWRNADNGQNRLWLMNGLTRKKGSTINTLAGLSWVVGSIDDYNADGKADLFWRDKVTGKNRIWLMSGSTRLLGGEVEVLNRIWRAEKGYVLQAKELFELFPANAGDSRSYSDDSEAWKETILGPDTYYGEPVFAVEISDAYGTALNYFSTGSEGFKVHGYDYGSSGGIYSPPIIYAKDDMVPGTSIKGPYTNISTPSLSSYSGTYTTTYLGTEAVQTPLGTFNAAKRFMTTSSLPGNTWINIINTWFQPGVGLVKVGEAGKDTSNGFSIAGGETYINDMSLTNGYVTGVVDYVANYYGAEVVPDNLTECPVEVTNFRVILNSGSNVHTDTVMGYPHQNWPNSMNVLVTDVSKTLYGMPAAYVTPEDECQPFSFAYEFDYNFRIEKELVNVVNGGLAWKYLVPACEQYTDRALEAVLESQYDGQPGAKITVRPAGGYFYDNWPKANHSYVYDESCPNSSGSWVVSGSCDWNKFGRCVQYYDNPYGYFYTYMQDCADGGIYGSSNPGVWTTGAACDPAGTVGWCEVYSASGDIRTDIYRDVYYASNNSNMTDAEYTANYCETVHGGVWHSTP